MSTILDALRKVEQDHQAQNTDVRARLLTLPPRPQPRIPQKNVLPWVISLGLAVVGFLIGAGIIMYQPSPLITSMTAESAGPERSPSAQTTETAAKPISDKVTEVPIIAGTPAAQSFAVPFVPTPTSQEQSAPTLARLQRSPFASRPSPQSSRSAQSATSPAASQAQQLDEYIIEPLPQDVWDDENEVLAPEDEAHFISPSPEPLSAPVINPASSAPPAYLDASLSLLQWSPDAAERFAFISVADGPPIMAYEGDRVGAFTIVKIHKNKVDLRANDADGADLTLHLR